MEHESELELARQRLREPQLLVRAVTELEVRAGDDQDGSFDGYGVVWDVIDSYGTSFAPGTFGRGGLDQQLYGYLWMHSPYEPIGVFYGTEDDHGLKIAGRWDGTQAGQDARVRAKSGSAPGLSVGFVPLGTDPEDPSRFSVARLVEVSQITARMAAVPGAQLVGVRSSVAENQQAQVAAARLRLLMPR